MCGIAGYVSFSSSCLDGRLLDAMALSLRHRGPDALGTLVDGVCGLAHARLSIIDVTGSPQPMQVPGSSVSLVYNGELYNFRELREQLTSGGTTCLSRGDTEVLLRWVEQKWDACLPRFDGIFGFAAWDRCRERLLLARDALGVKPLFYCLPAPGLLVFGSEIKSILLHPAVRRELDLDALRQVLRFRATYGERSLYRGIRQLRPGHYLEFSRSGLRSGCFYDLPDEVGHVAEALRGRPEPDIIRMGEEMLRNAVRRQLVADVPLGAFLSGGLDSSLLVALMRADRAPGEQVCTFSVGFANDAQSELPYARLVADALGTRHTEVHVAESDYGALLGKMTAYRDAPLSEPQDVAIAQMSVVARETVKVVLSGEGADEIFAGYPKYRFAAAPSWLRAALRIAGPARVAGLAGLFGLDSRRVGVAARALAQRDPLDQIVDWFSLERGLWSRLLPGLGWDEPHWSNTVAEHRAALVRIPAEPLLVKMQLVDCLTWLPGNLLERGDRMTMSAGLEMRVPFLDRQLVPYGIALTDRLKVRRNAGKWVMRHWARDRLPPAILDRPKSGFHIPLAEWLRGALRPMLHDYLANKNGLCGMYGDRAALVQLLDAQQVRDGDASLLLWTLLAAEIWYQDVFQQRVTLPRQPSSCHPLIP